MTKLEEKEYLRFKKHLNIQTESEDFVLKHILNRNNNRSILLYEIETIREDEPHWSGVHIKCTTNKGSYDFSVSSIGGNGWTNGFQDNISKQKDYISGDLYHKMD